MHLFSPYTLRDVTLRNRLAVSPMCQYSATSKGFATDWHFVHLGSRAVGGAGLIIVEATGVEPRGRISPSCLGLWSDDHIESLERIGRFVKEQGAAWGIQLAHAGRKASTDRGWNGGRPVAPADGGWIPVAPSALAFDDASPVPDALDEAGIQEIKTAFIDAARRAVAAGFDVVEVHAAHGYLLHQFLSPLTNRREDRWGGSFENRTRLVREVTAAVRDVMPERLPLLVRLSATDWVEGGWDVDQTVELSRGLKGLGADLIDVTSAGLVPNAVMPIGPGYQTVFAERVRREAGIASSAVGLIVSAHQADHVIRTGQADLVMLGRPFLRDPYWPLHAAKELGQTVAWPNQYLRA
ncbi:MAG TPA: NADH:flavin oxidoreductase/NADH oxidase [Azospirillaceae bacterium]|nr:NADH:flavin oxidoreductase/NADH oxidase [Azospirillaceae bacterium]